MGQRSTKWLLFHLLQKLGNIEKTEMYRVFNMGIGMIAVVSEKEAQEVLERLTGLGEKAYVIGSIQKKTRSDSTVSLV